MFIIISGYINYVMLIGKLINEIIQKIFLLWTTHGCTTDQNLIVTPASDMHAVALSLILNSIMDPYILNLFDMVG